MAIEINIPKPVIDYNDLDNKPTLVTDHSQLNLDDGTNPHGTTANDVGAYPNPTGTTSQYIRGDGSLETFPSIPNPSDFVAKSQYSPARSVLAQQSGTGSPSSVQIGTNEILGRLSGGGSNIKGLSVSEVKGLLDLSGTNTGDQDLSGLVPTSRNLTINGVTQDLSADRSFTVTASVDQLQVALTAQIFN